MNQKQSLELFKKGEHAWNTWADERIAERKALEESGVWITNRHLHNEQTSAWHEQTKADFSGIEFPAWADFRSFRFPGHAMFQGASFSKGGNFASSEFLHDANFLDSEFGSLCIFASVTFCGETCFRRAMFKGEARFRGAKFSSPDDVNFEEAQFMGLAHFGAVQFQTYPSYEWATFYGVARFDEVAFSDGASFHSVTFLRHAIFDNAQFSRDVAFDNSVFEDGVYFERSSFVGRAGFSRVSGKALMLDHPTFECLPDFTGAHFDEAPVFDQMDLQPECFRDASDERTRVGAPERWRALRRLAVQGHDHARELLFFKGEMMARRGTRDTWTNLWFWVGWTYQILSDFGCSLKRPLLGLAITVVAFACLYALPNDAVWESPMAWEIPCQAGSGDVRVATLVLSLHNAIPVAGIASTGKLPQAYACVYGLDADTTSTLGPSASTNAPIIPDWVVVLGFCQSVVSAVLVFLALLAVRNRFRIA